MTYTVKDNLSEVLKQTDRIFLQGIDVAYAYQSNGNIYFYEAEYDREYGTPDKIFVVPPEATFEIDGSCVLVCGRTLRLYSLQALKPDISKLK